MVVCKFFEQGYCRYGQNCRFEHVYGSKYSYHAPASNQTTQNKPQSVVTDEQLVSQVQTDVKTALESGQWILSSYAPFKEKSNFPGISDLSPEETRLFIYEAKANNNVDQAVAFINNRFIETRQQYEQLLQPTLAIVKVLRSIYNGELPSSPFLDMSHTSNAAPSSIFRSAVQGISFNQNTSTNPSVFQQSNSIFGQTEPKSVFAQANQNAFKQSDGKSIFGSSDNTAAKSLFAQASQNAFSQSPTSVFASASQQAFGPNEAQSTFGPKERLSTPFSNMQSVFQSPSVFGGFSQQNSVNDEGFYSQMEDLTAEDIEAYNSVEFKLGFVPHMPPPLSLCK